jgi:hypothetical protein
VKVRGVIVGGSVRVIGVNVPGVGGVRVMGVNVPGVGGVRVMGVNVPPVMGEMVGREPVVMGVKVAWASAPPPPQEKGSIVGKQEGSMVGNPPP